MIAWYFSKDDCRLRYGDGREIEVGATHTVDCEPILCEQGLHASRRLIDALSYSPGNVLWLVELSGDIAEGDDKCAASQRTYLARLDSEDLLRRFARHCALEVIRLWDAPEVVKQHLKTGDESLRAAAWDAARTAAWDAARDAARAAAWDAAWAAARAAAWAAAWAAARDAASAAAWAAAWDAASDVARAAAWDAASDVARAEMWDKFNTKLTEMVLDEMELP